MARPVVKICGICEERGLDAALHAGADMVGFVFFARSPRHISFERAADLAVRTASRARTVALTVDADDATLEAIVAMVRPDILQLHGTETPERVTTVQRRFGCQVMRALPVGSAADLGTAARFDEVADYLILDAPPPEVAARPGGHGKPFDWALLADFRPRRPWLLAGGLHAGNVAAALAETDATGVDVSSGVESAPGVKDPDAILEFVKAARP